MQKSKAAMFRVLTGAEHHGAVEKTKKMYACNEGANPVDADR